MRVTLCQRWVREGGKLFLHEGSRCYEQPEEHWVLLRELGWTDTSGFDDAPGSCQAQLDPAFFRHASLLRFRQNPLEADLALPEGAEVLGTFENGKPAVVRWSVGQGEVIACTRSLSTWLQPDLHNYWADLRAWAGVPAQLEVEPARHDIVVNLLARDDLRYLYVFRCGKDSPVSGFLGLNDENTQDPITIKVKVLDLPPGTYTVSEVAPKAANRAPMTAADWAAGLELELAERELRMFRLRLSGR